MSQQKRNVHLPKGFQCPPDVGDIDCYHELMGLWMRLLMEQKHKRLSVWSELKTE